MEHVFWLENTQIAGRPGPNQIPWKLDEFANNGFAAILSVNDGELCHVQDIHDAGLVYACLPMSENAPPRAGDRELSLLSLPKTYEFIETNLNHGKVLIHCTSGKDRTGLVMAFYLTQKFDMPVDEAMCRVRNIRPIAFTAEGWWEYSRSLLFECR